MAGVQSIERAFALLRALATAPGGVTELANRVGLPKSTVARLLQALEAEGAIERGSDNVFRIGHGFSDLFETHGNPGPSLVARARPFLIDLTDELDEAAGLEIYDAGSVQFVDQVAPDHDVQVRDWTGESGPAHALPTGLVFLAHLDTTELDRYLTHPLESLTSNTITEPEALRERVAQVRSAGYAWGFEEFAPGINSVAAPVFGPDGIAAALQVHGPTFRFPDPNRMHDIGRLVANTAARLGEQLQGLHDLDR